MAMASEEEDDALRLLSSPLTVERTKGVERLQRAMTDGDRRTAAPIEAAIVDRLLAGGGVGGGGREVAAWETRHGALLGAKAVIAHPTYRPSAVADFEAVVRERAVRMLDEDDEYTVRIAAGDLIGAFCQKYGCQVYTDISETLLQGITKNLDLGESPGATHQCTHLVPNSPNEVRCATAKEIFDDTSKWKHLDTWLKCLQCIIEGCGTSFNVHISLTLLDLLGKVLMNWSRFVRESCSGVLAALISCNISQDNTLKMAKEESAICANAEIIANQLKILLSDNYSEVRMSASLAVRKFLLGLPDAAARQTCLAILLPPLCFNRYYMAEGVRLHSQETWVLVTSGEGKSLVEQNIDHVISFDILQLKVSNHEIRETACTCIREMAQKLSPSAMEPFVIPLLTALQDCLASAVWTVRDAALVTCGNIIALFPQQSKELSNSLTEYFFIGLEDNAPPVREAAAIALGCTVRVYGDETFLPVLAKIKTGLEGVKSEKTDDEKHLEIASRSSSTAAESSADPRICDGGSCPDASPAREVPHEITAGNSQAKILKCGRQSELWELADGCLCLMCELSQQPTCAAEVTKLLPALAKAAAYNHYSQHIFFLQSVCKQLPTLLRNLGKRSLKLYVELFFDVVFGAAASDKLPVSTAAAECIVQLGDLLGCNIFRARVENYNPRYLQYVKATGSVS